MNHSTSVKTAWIFVLAITLLWATGCQQELETGYGRAHGTDYTDSVNGTIVFDRMIKSSRRRIDHYRKVSPRWYDYDTIFWIPDHIIAPQQEAIDKAEQWVASGDDKTLVYVARDYDAAIVYWEQLKNDSEWDSQYARNYADALSRLSAQGDQLKDNDCDWFDWRIQPFQTAKQISGSLAQSVETQQAEVHYASLPVPGDIETTGKFNDYDVEVMLTVDNQPMVYSLTKENWNGSRIIIVGNGSFILNLPLTSRGNRQLAENLVETAEEIDYDRHDILFVENDKQIAISDVEAPDNSSKWAWITKPPLRYIVPNLVFWCMLFCFVYFPIFGRPGRIERKSTANFKDHIFALARLISGTQNRSQPMSWLEQYRKSSDRNPKHR